MRSRGESHDCDTGDGWGPDLTALVGGASYLLFNLLGLKMPLLACLTFGALISPTDPIAVMSLLKRRESSQIAFD